MPAQTTPKRSRPRRGDTAEVADFQSGIAGRQGLLMRDEHTQVVVDEQGFEPVSMRELDLFEATGEGLSASRLLASTGHHLREGAFEALLARDAIRAGEPGAADHLAEGCESLALAIRCDDHEEAERGTQVQRAWSLPPIWRIDAALNAKRSPILKAACGGGRVLPNGDFFFQTGASIVQISPTDWWSASRRGMSDHGAGLTTFLAFWNSIPLASAAEYLGRQAGLIGDRL